MTGGRTSHSHARGFTLMELLVVMVIVAGLAAMAFPVSQRVMAGARASTCMTNLKEIGAALQLYLADHNNTMPKLVTARASKDSDEAALDTALKPYTENEKIFRCPADDRHLWEKTGTSYLWDNLLNEQNVGSLDFMGLVRSGNRIPVVSDKEDFHKYRDVKVNILYADGHVAKDIQFIVGGK